MAESYITGTQAEAALSKSADEVGKSAGLRVVGVELPQTAGGGAITPVANPIADTSVRSQASFMQSQQATKQLYDEWGRQMDRVADDKMRTTSLLGDANIAEGMRSLQSAILQAGTKFEERKRVADAEAKAVKNKQDGLNATIFVGDHLSKLEMAPDNTTLEVYMAEGQKALLEFGKQNNIDPDIIQAQVVNLRNSYTQVTRGFLDEQRKQAQAVKQLNVKVAQFEFQQENQAVISELGQPGISDARQAELLNTLAKSADEAAAKYGFDQLQVATFLAEQAQVTAASVEVGTNERVKRDAFANTMQEWASGIETIKNDRSLSEASKALAIDTLRLRLGIPQGTNSPQEVINSFSKISAETVQNAQSTLESKRSPQDIQNLNMYAAATYVQQSFGKQGISGTIALLEALPDDQAGKGLALRILRAKLASGAQLKQLGAQVATKDLVIRGLQIERAEMIPGKAKGKDGLELEPSYVLQKQQELDNQIAVAKSEREQLALEASVLNQNIPDWANTIGGATDEIKSRQAIFDKYRVPPSGNPPGFQ